MLIRILASVSTLLLAAACGCASSSSDESASSATHVGARVVASGSQTGIRGERDFVVRNSDEWTALWREHGSFQIPPPAQPDVDWTTSMVIGVVAGRRPTPGYELSLTRLERRSSHLRAVITETKPVGAAQAAVLTTPFLFVAVPKSDEPVEFVRE